MKSPATDAGALHIPVIDILPGSAEIASHLVDAAARYGFVFVKGEGLGFSSQSIDDAFSLSQRFFHLPVEEKERCAIQSNNIGWSCMHSELLDPEHQKKGDFKEAMNFGEFVDGKAPQALPPTIKEHESDINKFGQLCHELCIKLLCLFAVGLKIDPKEGGQGWFASRHDPSKGKSGRTLRWLHYPAMSKQGFDAAIDIRAGAHSDYGSLTLLFQRPGQPGLEILDPTSTWSSVPIYPPGTESDDYPPILVNIGDLMEFWTIGLLKSTVHRVVFPRGEANDRYSIAYFCHPLDHVEIEAVPSAVIKEREKEAKGGGLEKMTAEGYLQKRLRETYGWAKQEEAAAD